MDILIYLQIYDMMYATNVKLTVKHTCCILQFWAEPQNCPEVYLWYNKNTNQFIF